MGPLAGSMAKEADAEHAYFQVLRATIVGFSKGLPPILAVEVGRRSIPGHIRPTFQEVESLCRNRAPQAAPAPAPPGEAAA